MRFALPVTEATLPRLEELRTACRPARGTAPRSLRLPEADDAAHLVRVHEQGLDAPRAPPGLWLVAGVGPVEGRFTPEGVAYWCAVEVVAWVVPDMRIAPPARGYGEAWPLRWGLARVVAR